MENLRELRDDMVKAEEAGTLPPTTEFSAIMRRRIPLLLLRFVDVNGYDGLMAWYLFLFRTIFFSISLWDELGGIEFSLN